MASGDIKATVDLEFDATSLLESASEAFNLIGRELEKLSGAWLEAAARMQMRADEEQLKRQPREVYASPPENLDHPA